MRSSTVPVVSEMSVVPVAGYDCPLLNLSGLHGPVFTRTLILLRLSNGLQGVAEVPGGEDVVAASRRAERLVLHRTLGEARAILDDVRAELGELDRLGRGEQTFDQRVMIHVLAGVDAALLDLTGRFWGCPAADVLGRRRRDAVPFLGYLFYVADVSRTGLPYATPAGGGEGWERVRWQPALDPDSIVRQAGAAIARYGFTTLKLKGGVFPGEAECEAVERLAERFPGVLLDIDPNGAWPRDLAVGLVNRLKPILSYVEDPTRGREGMAYVRQRTGVPHATNMCACDWPELALALKLGAVDIPLADPHFWTMSGAVEVARRCADWGLTWGVHSNNHFDISLAMVVHCGAVAPGEIRALDTHYIWQDGQSLGTAAPEIRDGVVAVPEAPGLGITLDMKRVEAAHALYQASGVRARDDSAAMREIRPGWKFHPERPCLG